MDLGRRFKLITAVLVVVLLACGGVGVTAALKFRASRELIPGLELEQPWENSRFFWQPLAFSIECLGMSLLILCRVVRRRYVCVCIIGGVLLILVGLIVLSLW
jgi:hypothetical protein